MSAIASLFKEKDHPLPKVVPTIQLEIIQKQHEKRDFGELIRLLRVNGEVLRPIEEIAALAFNYNLATVVNKDAKMWVNEHYDLCAYYEFETDILKEKGLKHRCLVKIWRDYSVERIIQIGKNEPQSFAASNQIVIFKLLERLNFI